MNRKDFIQSSLLATAAFSTGQSMAFSPQAQREIYELKIYSMRFGGNQGALHKYLENALIPALDRMGISKVGVFRELGMTDPQKLYVLIVYPSMEVYMKALMSLSAGKQYQEDSKEYHEISKDRAPYDRFSSKLMLAFEGLPQIRETPSGERLFEYRVYEGYNEDAVNRKVEMFNVEEFPLFDKVGLHPVFFGQDLIGPTSPCLSYMIHFKDMEERDANWQKFLQSPEWNEMKAKPRYANTVSKIHRVFLLPTEYSAI